MLQESKIYLLLNFKKIYNVYIILHPNFLNDIKRKEIYFDQISKNYYILYKYMCNTNK